MNPGWVGARPATNPGSVAGPLLVPGLLSPEAARLGKGQPWINICPGFWVPMYNSRKRREDRERREGIGLRVPPHIPGGAVLSPARIAVWGEDAPCQHQITQRSPVQPPHFIDREAEAEGILLIVFSSLLAVLPPQLWGCGRWVPRVRPAR